MNPTEPIYFDHAATTPLREEVFEVMRPYLTRAFGNAGSLHRFGRDAKKAIDRARAQVANLIGADPRDMIFTSGGTEANNLAVQSFGNVLGSAVEHHSVLHAAKLVHQTPVNCRGEVILDELLAKLPGGTELVSVMHGNNETGTLQPIETIGEHCRVQGVAFHTDAIQSAGKILLNVANLPVDLVSLSAHKIYGPKGVGALYAHRDISLTPCLRGGTQERGRRAGTENVAGIVGFGAACELAMRELPSESRRLRGLRDSLERAILAGIPGTWINGSQEQRLPHILNVGFPGIEGEQVMLELDAAGIAVGTGSACTSGSVDASHVLLAMGQDHTCAHSGVRFSLGRSTTEKDIQSVCAALRRLLTHHHGSSANKDY